jgi:hypothetical protein
MKIADLMRYNGAQSRTERRQILMPRTFLFLLAAVFLACALLPLSPSPLKAFDQTGCEKDCLKCHTISNQEVKEISRA